MEIQYIFELVWDGDVSAVDPLQQETEELWGRIALILKMKLVKRNSLQFTILRGRNSQYFSEIRRSGYQNALVTADAHILKIKGEVTMHPGIEELFQRRF